MLLEKKKEKKTSSSYNVGQFANNPRKDTYPEELIGLVIVIFTVWPTFLFTLWQKSKNEAAEKQNRLDQ